MNLTNKRILIGVSGGIAAYKSVALVSALCQKGAEVRVVMTQAATRFVGPATFHGITHCAVELDDFASDQDSGIRHIDLANWGEVLCVVPASCNTLAKMAQGLADDLLSTVFLATSHAVVVVPAMNKAMWQNPATQNNLALLEGRGVQVLGPAKGMQACGQYGEGRMVEPEEVEAYLEQLFAPQSLSGLRILVSAGPTHEPWDAVRHLSNLSSGKMGFALAQQAQTLGAQTTLISGPVALPTPHSVHRINVTTAEQMYEAVLREVSKHDIFISAAAVADYRPAQPVTHKIKKGDALLTLTLEKTPDILSAVSACKRVPFLVGFAAETEEIQANAKQKLLKKNLDLIVANAVGSQPHSGFDTHLNYLQVFSRTEQTKLGPALKHVLAKELMHLVARHYFKQKQALCQNHTA